VAIVLELSTPAESCDAASAILRSAWRPPCIDYSPEFLAWNFSDPESHSIATIARVDDDPVAFVAAVRKRVIIAGCESEMNFSSFFSGVPGSGVASIGVLRTQHSDFAMQAYHAWYSRNPAPPESIPFIAFDAAGFRRKQLNPAKLYVGMSPKSYSEATASLSTAANWLKVYGGFKKSLMAILPHLSIRTLQMFGLHPWQRQLIVASRIDVGCAVVELTRVLQPNGQRTIIPSLLYCFAEDADAVRSMLAWAAPAGQLLSLPNCQIDQKILRSAGVRETGKFHAYLLSTSQLDVDSTATEIL